MWSSESVRGVGEWCRGASSEEEGETEDATEMRSPYAKMNNVEGREEGRESES